MHVVSRGDDLTRLFHPRSVAVVGASSNVDSPGYDYVHSLREFGFAGDVYPVNPRGGDVDGYPAFASLAEVPVPVDLAISCVPSSAVLGVIEQCGEKAVPFLHLFTARFSETGDAEAAQLEREVEARALAMKVRILGPNGMGVHHPAAGLSFRPDLPKSGGGVAVLSQSGNNAVEIIVRGSARGLRLGKVVNYGNGMDLTPAVLLRYLAEDSETAVIGAYVEGVPAGAEFFRALKLAAAKKPVIIHKAGRTVAGAKSAASHTAALAGSHEIWSAAIHQAGGIEARSQEQLIDLSLGASILGRIGGTRTAVVGGGGGRSVQSADACEENGLEIVPLPQSVKDQVHERAPQLGSWVGNPVDQSILAGTGLSSNRLLEWMLASDAYDFGIANVGEEWFLGRPDAPERLRHACDRLASIVEDSSKPVTVVLGPSEFGKDWQCELIDSIRTDLVGRGLAVFPTVERAAWTLGRLTERTGVTRNRSRWA